MSDRIRQVMAYLIAMGMITAVAAAPTVAQTADPNAERVFEVAGVNADTVDGKHAIWATTNKAKRAKKLVATDKNGFLPSNIVKPYWGNVKNVPTGFADGVDHRGVTGVKLTRVESSGTLPPGFVGNVQVYCPSDSLVTGGGYHSSAASTTVYRSWPIGDNRWKVYAHNPESSETAFSVWAVCLSVSKA